MPAGLHRLAYSEHGRRDSHADEDDDGGRRGDRRRRVHDDAQWAVVGGGLNGVDVRHLDNGQQRKQDQAHYDFCIQGARGRAAILTGLSWRPRQSEDLITLRYTT